MIKITRHEDGVDLQFNVMAIAVVLSIPVLWYLTGLPSSFNVSWANAGAGVIAGLVLFGCTLLAAGLFSKEERRKVSSAQERENSLVGNLAAGAAAGVYEEIFTRGILQPLATTYIGVIPAIIVTNVLFGALHRCGNWRIPVITGLLGVALGVLLVASGSLLTVIIAHSTVNIAMSIGDHFWPAERVEVAA